MTYVCNGLTSTEAATTYDGYKFTFANAAYKTDGKTVTDLVLTSNSYNLGGASVPTTAAYKFVVDKAFIDSSTDHATTISYVYKDVSSVDDATNGHNVVVNGWTGTTKFACLLSTTLQSYAWVDAPAIKGSGTDTNPQYPATAMNVLKYSTAVGTHQYIAVKFLKGTNSFDPTRFTMTFDGALNTYYKINDAKLVSDATGTVDYFDLATPALAASASATIASDGTTGTVLSFDFIPKSETSVPQNDIPSTLKLTLVDAFGHENLYSLPVLIKK
jgi:hypothetical protein